MNDLQEFDNMHDCHTFNGLHVCSSCWGILVLSMRKEEDKKIYTSVCELCGENTKGYVTKKWVSRRIEQNRGEAIEAKHALRDAIPWMRTKTTESQIMKELGF